MSDNGVIKNLQLMATYANNLRSLAVDAGLYGVMTETKLEDDDYDNLIYRASMEKAIGYILQLAENLNLSQEMIESWKGLYHDQ